MPSPLALAVPIFSLAIAGEYLVARRRGRTEGFHFGTMVSDVSCGATYQALELVLRVVTVGIYTAVFEHAAVVHWDEGSTWPWVIALLGVDLGYYLWHRASHVVNALWAVHGVHHHSEDYNLAVALRQPLLEPLTWTPFFCALALVGVPPDVALLSFAFNMFFQFWLHTELVDKLPRPIEWLFNTPSHHRVHHGIEPEYLDKNYGGILIVWDRLLGTFEPERRRPTYGTTVPLRSFDPVWANLEHWHRIARLAARGRSLRERLYAVIAHPAWVPGGRVVAKTGARPPKFRPSVSPRVLARAMATLASTAILLALVLALESTLSLPELGVAFGVIATAYVALAATLQRKPWAARADLARAAAIVAATAIIASSHPEAPTLLCIALAAALAWLPTLVPRRRH